MQPASYWTVALALTTSALAALPACGDAKYPAPSLAAPQTALTVTPIATDPRVDDLERRVVSLEKRLATQAASSPVVQPVTWSCAAQCVTKYHCTTNGDSNVTFNHLEATRETALDAFNSVRAACPKDADLEVSVQCEGGHIHEIDASLVNACVKN